MKIFTGTTVKELKKGADSVTATLVNGDKTTTVTAERVVLAIGIVGKCREYGSREDQGEVDRTHIVVDQWCKTDEPGMYAIGDVVGPPWLAHKAMHEA